MARPLRIYRPGAWYHVTAWGNQRRDICRDDRDEAVQVIEEMKGEQWEQQFRDRRGDWGRDVALWLGRRRCQMKLRELVEVAGVSHYGSVATALRYLEQ